MLWVYSCVLYTMLGLFAVSCTRIIFLYNFCFSQLFMATLKRQSNGLLYSNTVIGILAVDGWTVIFGTARRGPTEAPPHCTKCNSWPVNWQCTNLESFGVAL